MRSPHPRSRGAAKLGIALALLLPAQALGFGLGPPIHLEADPASTCPAPGFVSRGDTLRFQAFGYAPGSEVTLDYACPDADPIRLSSVTANDEGGITGRLRIPDSLPVCPHPFQLLTAEGVEIEPSPPGGDGPSERFRSSVALIVVGPAESTDRDRDGVPDFCDNCPEIGNPLQEDPDEDGRGTRCDAFAFDPDDDRDGDGLPAHGGPGGDPCPFDVENDADGDGICEGLDNCPIVANPHQRDTDRNGIGDACQTRPSCSDGFDNDGDGWVDHPADVGCHDPLDSTETDPALPCDDGIDNDTDALADSRANGAGDPGCPPRPTPQDIENPQCDDGIDNDQDGAVDHDGDFGLHDPDPQCTTSWDGSEAS